MPNHPEIRINTLTQTIDRDSMNTLNVEPTMSDWKSLRDGSPRHEKSALTTSTRNIATNRRSSKLDCLGPVVIEEIAMIKI